METDKSVFYDGREKVYKNFLHDLSKKLSSKNIEALKFVSDIPDGDCEKISDGTQLMKAFLVHGFISYCPDGLENLSEILKDIRRHDLSGETTRFIENMKKTSDPMQERGKGGKISSVHQKSKKLDPPGIFTKKNQDSNSKSPTDDLDYCIEIPTDGNEAIVYGVSESNQETELPFAVYSDAGFYRMDSDPHGYCLIISNEDFKATRMSHDDGYCLNLDDRKSSAVDVRSLEDIFSSLKFKVEKRENKTAKEMFSIFELFANLNHAPFDCFITFILSHGCRDGVYGIDGDILPIGAVVDLLERCPSLQDKPKVLFVQCCRGDDIDGVYKTSITPSINIEEFPNKPDFFLAFATPSGYTSWRSEVDGSWFIDMLCEVIRGNLSLPLEDIMKKVSEQLYKAYTSEGHKQVPQTVSTLAKNLKFM
ncbi:caspase-3-like [Rhopilema esculentum]|uniref:caspase-3-like n=1 Tax=Rhopilema esculentum TaxID=499914 RepID=UPI0031E12FD3|eukprot:gene10346-19044_t